MISMQTFQQLELFSIICPPNHKPLNLVIFDWFKFDLAQIFLYSLLNYLYNSNNLILTP
jgi:hypothetical protein